MRNAFILVLFPLLLGCPKKPTTDLETEPPQPQFLPFASADLKNGKELYDSRCAQCHGPTGKGDGPTGESFDVAPTNFVSWQPPADEELFLWIRDGGAARSRSMLMPGFGRSLTAEQIRDVAAYTKTFSSQQ